MKKGLLKALAIAMSVVMLLTISIIMTVTADEDVVTDYKTLLPENYEVVDKIFDVANESNSRVTMNNWKYWGGSVAYPTLEDQYGLTRISADYAYLDIEINNVSEYFAVGMMAHKNYFQTSNCENYYYESVDGINWKPIIPIGTAIPADSDYYEINFVDSDYRFEVDVIGGFSSDSKYFRTVTFCPNVAWTPILDFVNIFDKRVEAPTQIEFDSALNGCDLATIKKYFDDAKTLAQIFSDNTDYKNLTLGSRGNYLGFRTEAGSEKGLYAPQGSNVSYDNHQDGPYIIIPVTDHNVVETGLIFDSAKSSAYGLVYYTSSDKQHWTKVESTSIATKEVTNLSQTDGYVTFYNASETEANKAYRRQRIANLPEGTKYLKIHLYNTGWWDVILDYVDVYNLSAHYDNALNNCHDTPETVIEGYNDADYSSKLKVSESGVTNASGNLNYRTGETNYIKLIANGTGYVSFKVNDKCAIDTIVIFDESADHKDSMGVKFYYTTDISSLENITWNELSDYSVATKNLGNKNMAGSYLGGRNETNAIYFAHAYRVNDLPSGTVAVKMEISGRSWAPVIDYIEIYEDESKYNDAFDGVELTEAYKLFEEQGAITIYDSSRLAAYSSNMSIATGGLARSDGNYAKCSEKLGYLVIPVTSANFIETSLFLSTGQNPQAYLKYYVTTAESVNSENVGTVTWSEVSDSLVATKMENGVQKWTTGNVMVDMPTYSIRTERVTNLPKETTYLKIEIVSATTWEPGLDYVKVYNTAELIHTHTFGEWLYNPIKHTVEKFCNDDYSYLIKGNVADAADAEGVLDILDIVKMNAIAGGAEYDGEADVLDGDSSGVFDFADLIWLRNFILRKIFG